MDVVMVYSEAGGVSKTSTAVSLAALSAAGGKRTVLIDLDPRAAATKWIGVQPVKQGLHVGAILADEDPVGWAEELAVPSGWLEELRIIPSDRKVANREKEQADHSELRLKQSLEGLQADLVVIDCPNRQGGLLTQNALAASTGVVYAAKANQDGIDGVSGAQESVLRFKRSRERIGAPLELTELGIVVGDVADTVRTRVEKMALADLAELGEVFEPPIPRRTIVNEARMTGTWFGDFDKGAVVSEAYAQVLSAIEEKLL